MKVMNRIETLNYIESEILNNKRLVISRYSDGEYLMMCKQRNNTHDSFDILPNLLKKSIQNKKQLVCINYLKPHNVERKDRWCIVQKYLSEIGSQSLYGCCNWNIYDFQNENKVLPLLFSGNVLLVTGHVEESKAAFKTQSNLKIYPALKKNASSEYHKIKSELIEICSFNKFDNILFACGPIGKALLTDLIDVCDSNLIDIGALLNAIINEYSQSDKKLIEQWTMSWTKNVNVSKQAELFFKKLKKEIRNV